MKNLFLILCLISIPAYAFSPEFCSDYLEAGCVDYEQGAIEHLETHIINGKYYIKVFTIQGMPNSLIPYGKNKEAMYRDFDFNYYHMLKEEKHNYNWEYVIQNYDKVKQRTEAKAINEYNNLKIDKEKFMQSYIKAKNYADIHIEDKDENGIYLNAGTGCYQGLVREYFEKYDKEALKIYDTINNYCNSIYFDENMAEIRNCLFEKLNNI